MGEELETFLKDKKIPPKAQKALRLLKNLKEDGYYLAHFNKEKYEKKLEELTNAITDVEPDWVAPLIAGQRDVLREHAKFYEKSGPKIVSKPKDE